MAGRRKPASVRGRRGRGILACWGLSRRPGAA